MISVNRPAYNNRIKGRNFLSAFVIMKKLNRTAMITEKDEKKYKFKGQEFKGEEGAAW